MKVHWFFFFFFNSLKYTDYEFGWGLDLSNNYLFKVFFSASSKTMGPLVGHGNVEVLFLGVNCGNKRREDACLQCAFGCISLINAKHQLITMSKLKN